MKLVKRSVVLLICTASLVLFGGFSPVSKQVNVFEIKKAGIQVGTLYATLSQEGSYTIYVLSSSSSFWMGTRVFVKHYLKCVYDKNKLVRADMETNSSKGKYVSWISWKGDHYEYDVKSYKHNKSGKFPSPIDFSLVKMYFQEPPLSKRNALAENHAEMVKVACAGNHVFNAYVNEKPNVYYYNGGKLKKADLTSSSFEYTIERSE